MTALSGDLGDSSPSRLPIYSITKSAMIPHFPDYQFTQLPNLQWRSRPSSSPLSFRALPEHPRRRERNPEDVCRINADAGNSLSRMFQRYQTVGQRLSSPRVMLSAEPRRHRGSESKHPDDACASMLRQGIVAKTQGGAGIHACVKDHLQSELQPLR
jgi:hypothetical protein